MMPVVTMQETASSLTGKLMTHGSAGFPTRAQADKDVRPPLATVCVDSATCNSRCNSVGAALLLVLGYGAALSLCVSIFLSYLNQSIAAASRVEKHQQCMNIAEAGIDTALSKLRTDPSSYRDVEHMLLGPGRFSVSATAGSLSSEFHVSSVGELVYSTDSGDVTAYAVRIDADVVLHAGNRVEIRSWKETRVR